MLHGMPRLRSLIVCALACGCGARTTAEPPPRTPESPKHQDASGPRAPAAAAHRTLGPRATFADLVAAAIPFDGDESDAPGCILTEDAAGYRLSASITAALRPLPLPARQETQALASHSVATVFTRYGRQGTAPRAMAFAAFTYAPPTQAAQVAVLTSAGPVLLKTGGHQAKSAPVSIEQAVAELSASAGPNDAVYVAAEADVPVADLARLLSFLDADGRTVALAVALPDDVNLPERTTGTQVTRCAGGLPETDEPALQPAANTLAESLSPLRERATSCLAQAEAPGQLGGRVELALRVNEHGRVTHTCIVDAENPDDARDGCLLALARTLRFAPARERGVFDVQVPIALRPVYEPALRAVCPSKTDAAAFGE